MTIPDSDDDRTVIRQIPAGPAAGAPAGAGSHDSSSTALPIGTFIGEFEIVGIVGEGGFGIVYVALDRSLQRRVALKEYMPSGLAARTNGQQVSVKSARHLETFDTGLKSFVNEARLLAHFDHPALVKVHRFWEANGTAYMVMPLYEGMTLKDALRQYGAPPPESLLMSLLGPLTEALAVLHAQQCYHRDIAPDNIMLLTANGQPVLLDFGAARRVIGDMTQALTVILKPGYAPLEQYAETPGMKQGPWTDVYALAAVVYFAIAQRAPPPAVGRLVDDQLEPLARLAAGRYSERLLQTVDRALGVRPQDRTQSIDEFREQLGFAPHIPARESGWSQFEDSASATAPSGWHTTTGTHVPQPTPAGKGTAGGRAGARVWLGVAAVASIAAAAGAYYAYRPEPAPTAAPVTAPAAAPAPEGAVAAAPAAPADNAVPPPQPAPSPTTPSAAPLTPATPLSIDDHFSNIVKAQTPGFEVEASPARRELRIGKDRLSFSVKSTRAGFVYVLLADTSGLLLLFFPNSQSSNNAIRAGQTVTLPQKNWPLDTLEPPGAERFLVIVSEHQRDFSALGQKPQGMFVELDPSLAGAGVSGASATTSAVQGRAKCEAANCDVYGAARFDVEVVR
jgi:serine/threonine protein kinase